MKNHLIQSNNPLLSRYSESRVNWYFWDPRVLSLARKESRSVFLTAISPFCLRCEDLMREYFEDKEIADILNEHYTSILFDSNESPALARVLILWYRLSRREVNANLPLMATFSHHFSPWTLHDYSPGAQGRQSFCLSLKEDAQAIGDRQEQADINNLLFQRGLSMEQAPGTHTPLKTEALIEATERLLDIFDGGIEPEAIKDGDAHYAALESLLRLTYAFYHTPPLSARCLGQVVDAVYAMVSRGLKDHIGGGFFVRCGDRSWRQPVFVKNLDGNAQMLSLLLHLYAITRQADFYDEAQSLIEFVLGEMASGDGACVYSLHEDTPDTPGQFYLYSPAGIRQLLPQEYYQIFAQMYGLEAPPDPGSDAAASDAFAEFSSPPPDHQAVPLYRHCRLDNLARHHGISIQKCRSILKRCAEVLLHNTRTRRKPLAREDKILTRPNALMISALTEAGWLLSDQVYYHYAGKLLDYITERLWLGETVYIGRINTERLDGYTEPSEVERYLLAPGNLDDYAFLLRAILDCLAGDLCYERLAMAERLARLILENFYDEEHREFCYQDRRYYADAPLLRDIADGDCPGSVPTVLECFRRLAWMTGDARFLEISSRCSSDYISLALSEPLRYASMLKNLTQELNPLIVLWFLYDENNSVLAQADRMPVFAGRTQYHRVSYANLAEVGRHYPYILYQKLLELPRRKLQVIATRRDEILEVIDEQPDIYSLENQIKRANRIRL